MTLNKERERKNKRTKTAAVSSYFVDKRNFFFRYSLFFPRFCRFFFIVYIQVKEYLRFGKVFPYAEEKNILYLFIEWTRWALAMINFENQVK